MEFFNNHKRLFLTAFALFAFLSLFVAIIPAINNQINNSPLPGTNPLTEQETLGKALFVENGCVACHTQQVRNVEMDKIWGSRPGVAADYAYNERTDFWRNTATLMGTQRTGPDLTNIGVRQPSIDWHLLHLYQPRAVVKESIMPTYQWLFEVKNKLDVGDKEITVPDEYRKNVTGKIVATKDALALVAYMQSLKQAKLYDSASVPKFLYPKQAKLKIDDGTNEEVLDGAALYSSNCQSCHQGNGEGLKGAFPPLKGSPIVLADDPKLLIDIVMNGYDPRPEYAAMPAVGKNANLSDDAVTAIVNHERTSWGNNAKKLTVAEVKKIMEFVNKN